MIYHHEYNERYIVRKLKSKINCQEIKMKTKLPGNEEKTREAFDADGLQFASKSIKTQNEILNLQYLIQ